MVVLNRVWSSILIVYLFLIGFSAGQIEDQIVPANVVLIKLASGQTYFDNCIIEGDLDLSSKRIDGVVHFNNTKFLSPVNFSHTNFSNTANFRGTRFKDIANFKDSQFNGVAEFDDSQFNGHVDFSYSQFNHAASFVCSNFIGTSDFMGCNFSDADFRSSIFNKTADFRNSIFNSAVIFQKSKFLNHTTFNDALFQDEVYFKQSNFSRVAFVNSTFNGPAYFINASFSDDADFIKTAFFNRAVFSDSKFNGDAYFWGSQFSDTTYFVGSVFNGLASLKCSIFNGDADFRHARFNLADFAEMQFAKKAQFGDARFTENAIFDGIHFVGEALLEDTIFSNKLSLTEARYDRLIIRWRNINGGLIYNDAAYINLMKNFKNIGYFEDYDNCYYRYMVEHREHSWNTPEEYFLKFIDFLSQWSYGYGVRPLNPLISSVVFIIMFGFFWKSKGIGRYNEGNNKNYSESNLLSNSGNSAISWGFKETKLIERCKYKRDYEILLCNLRNKTLNIFEYLLYVLNPFIFSFTLFVSSGNFFVDPPELSGPMKETGTWTKRMFYLEKFLGGIFLTLFLISLSTTMIRAM